MTESELNDLAFVDAIIDKYNAEQSHLPAMMQEIQDHAAYLPRFALHRLAERLMLPVSYPFRMATFFTSFYLTPRGKNICMVCMGTACHVRGAQKLVEQLERDMGISDGQTTEDLSFSIQTVNCVGACALGPLVLINRDYHGNMTPKKLKQTIAKLNQEPGEA